MWFGVCNVNYPRHCNAVPLVGGVKQWIVDELHCTSLMFLSVGSLSMN